MPIFIKTEKFNQQTLKLSNSARNHFLSLHQEWVQRIRESGQYIDSGFLINEKKIPGGGGLLILEAKDYSTAKKIVLDDPMIKNELVIWDLQEWVPINENQSKLFNHRG
tara:strand:- start:106 stop:432 length:327 start_codon:yes stop_codon:yes gene_type:complete